MKPNKCIKGKQLLLIGLGIVVVTVAAILIVYLSGNSDPPDWIDPTTETLDTGQTTETTESTEPTEPSSTDPEKTEPPIDVTRPTDPPTQPGETTTPATKPRPYGDALVCEKFAKYSGAFVEDGKDMPVKNVAAILVTNRLPEFLEYATITYDVGGKTATFKVTGLPGGTSAWVLESTGMTVTDDTEYTYLDCVTAYRTDVEDNPKEITVKYNGSMIQAVNNTDRTLDNVAVYYKTLHTDGNYFGGITYRVIIGTLEPGASAERPAGHFDMENSDVVRVGWIEPAEETD